MTTPDITLDKAKDLARKREYRVSDFLTETEVQEVRLNNAKGAPRPKFDEIDAYVAEIIARFGYDCYTAWKAGDISEELMARMILAERAREVRERLALETIIVSSVAGANNPAKGGKTPKSLKTALKILKAEEDKAKGNQDGK